MAKNINEISAKKTAIAKMSAKIISNQWYERKKEIMSSIINNRSNGEIMSI